MSELTVKLPDGSSVSVSRGCLASDLAAQLATAITTTEPVVGIKIDRTLLDLRSPVMSGGELRPIVAGSTEALQILRHSTAHVMASAVQELFPNVKVTIGPAIETGFYYDFDVPAPFTEDDLARIEERMAQIIKKNEPFVRGELSLDEARQFFGGAGETYKLEIIDDIEKTQDHGGRVSTYTHGSFVDLCRGPHLERTGQIRAFKLTGVAGAYWRGDERNKMLQRIYGTAFFSKSDLQEHLARVEEAKRRDHRKLGRELDLFSMSELVGPGLVLWHPKGARVRHAIETFWREAHIQNGYELLYTPHIGKIDLWEKSGHTGFYAENMYAPMDVQGAHYLVKPMNCPFHIEIFQSALRSYRELPFRWAELGTVYRYERSGVLHGLLRVRGFTQDDAHIFCRPDQLKDEIRNVLRFVFHVLTTFGFREFRTYLSTRPEKYVGSLENWDTATDALRSVLESENIAFEVDPGEGVFYGPKIDIKMLDSLGRAWQCSTIQVDFNLPERFDMSYVGDDGARHRPIMVHRALMGSLERFFACLIEFYGGAFPTWLAPVQVRVLSITEKVLATAEQVTEELKRHGVRVDLDARNEKIGFKIREAQTAKVPYMILVGEKEAAAGCISVRSRSGSQEQGVALADFMGRITEEIARRAT